MRRFDPMRNDDGSVSVFRVSCLSIAALCMLIYASLNLLGCAGNTNTELTDESSSAPTTAENGTAEPEAVVDTSSDKRQLALKTLNEATAFYRDCGTINEGFEGCVFDFPKNVTAFYDVSANAADDGFAVILKSKDDSDPKCTFFEANSNGVMHAFDASGNESEECLK